MEDKIEQYKREAMNQIMQDIRALVEKLESLTEDKLEGHADGWDYSFKKVDEIEKELN
jgi:predicted GTPase